MNSLPAQTSTSTSQPIAPIDRRLSDAVAAIMNGVERVQGEYIARQLPSPELRKSIEVRLRDVRSALAPLRGIAEKDRAARAVAEMLTGWINAKVDNPAAKVAGYIMLLKDLPCWVIEQVCHDAGTGRIEGLDKAYPPSAAQLHALCEERLERLRKEAADLATVRDVKLVAHVPSEEERIRIGTKLMDLKERISHGSDDDVAARLVVKQEQSTAAAQAAQARVKAEYENAGLEPPKDLRFSLSLTARRAIAEIEQERRGQLEVDRPAYQEAGE